MRTHDGRMRSSCSHRSSMHIWGLPNLPGACNLLQNARPTHHRGMYAAPATRSLRSLRIFESRITHVLANYINAKVHVNNNTGDRHKLLNLLALRMTQCHNDIVTAIDLVSWIMHPESYFRIPLPALDTWLDQSKIVSIVAIISQLNFVKLGSM